MIIKQVEPTFLIYGLFDPRDGELRYVGKSTNGLARPRGHTCPSKLRPRTRKNNWLKSLLSKNLKPDIVVLEELSGPGGLDDLEKLAIAHYRSMGFGLYNSTDGGEGSFGRKQTEEEKLKKSISLRGRAHSAEHRRNVSAARKGMKFSSSHIENLRTAKGSKTFVEVTTGLRFDTQKAAAIALNIPQACVSYILCGKRNSFKGFVFKYEEPTPCL